MSCGVGRRQGLNLVLLWLWCRPAATALIRSLAWELPYAGGVALKWHTYIHTYIHKIGSEPCNPFIYNPLLLYRSPTNMVAKYEKGEAFCSLCLFFFLISLGGRKSREDWSWVFPQVSSVLIKPTLVRFCWKSFSWGQALVKEKKVLWDISKQLLSPSCRKPQRTWK